MVNVLIVYAHQLQHKSFNGALKDIAVQELTEQGHNVVVSDLYAQKFDLPSKLDIGKKGNEGEEEYYNYGTEMGKVYCEGELPKEIADEVEKVKTADFIIFQFPLNWFGFPAILKSWFDRVWISGFAFTFKDCWENGLLKGKTAMLAFTAGQPRETFITQDDHQVNTNAWLWPIEYGVLRFCGLDVIPAHEIYSILGRTQEEREEILNDWRQRLKGLLNEERKTFPNVHGQ